MMAFKSFCYVILLLNFVANFCMISGYTIKSMMKTRAYVPGVYMSEVPEPAKAVEQSALKSKLSADMKDAMKQKQKDRLAGIRAIQTAIKQKEVDERVVVDDETAVNIMAKLVKQRRESIKSYSDTGRQDLVAIEQAELEVISSYMPTQLSEEEVLKIVDETIVRLGATSIKDMGKIMNELKTSLQGKADISSIGPIIKTKLGGK